MDRQSRHDDQELVLVANLHNIEPPPRHFSAGQADKVAVSRDARNRAHLQYGEDQSGQTRKQADQERGAAQQFSPGDDVLRKGRHVLTPSSPSVNDEFETSMEDEHGRQTKP